MIRLMKNSNMILTEKLQKYYHLKKTDKDDYLTSEEILSPNQRK